MSDQSPTPQSQSTTPTPDPTAPAQQPANPGAVAQQAVPPPLPISPFTGEPYDPAWAVPLQKGGSSERTIQQIMRGEIERKASQSDGEAKK